jgi:hypothetical protein
MNRFFLVVLILLSFTLVSMDSPKLSKREIYKGAKILMPEDFVTMSDRDIADRYPSTKKPLAVFISSDTKADFTMNNTKAKFAGQTPEMLHDVYKVTIMETFDSTVFRKDRVKMGLNILKEGVRTVNKRKYAYFEFTSEYGDLNGRRYNKYNYIMYAPYKKHVLIFHFSCDQYVMEKYQPIAIAMMNSLKVGSNISLPDFYLQQNNNVPRKRQTPQDVQEMLNKSKTNIKK